MQTHPKYTMTQTLLKRAKEFLRTPYAKSASLVFQALSVCGVLYILYDKVGSIGWADVQNAMPHTVWFYVLFAGLYLIHPVTEWLVYRYLWGASVKRHFPVFLKMRVYNTAIMSYMGEAFLAIWSAKNLDLSARNAASSVKDSNILSALASNILTLVSLSYLFLGGHLETITNLNSDYTFYMGLAFGLGLLLIPFVLKYQHRLLKLTRRKVLHVFLMHSARLTLTLILQISIWSVAIPSVPLESWFLLIAAQLILTRIPFLPNTDLMFAGLGVSLMAFLEGPEAHLASMFLMLGALSQGANILAYLYGQWYSMRHSSASHSVAASKNPYRASSVQV